MRPLVPREKVILLALAVVLVVVGFYYFVYTPKIKQINTLSQQLKTQQAELVRLQAAASRLEELKRKVEQVQRDIREFESKLPSAREIPVLLVRLENLATQVGTNLTMIRPGPITQPSAAAPPPAKPGAPAAAPRPGASFQQFTLEINADGSFDMIENFVHGIETFPRFISMTDLRISSSAGRPGDNRPTLTLALQAITYVLPDIGAGR